MGKSFNQYLNERYTEDDVKKIHLRGEKKADDYIEFKRSISQGLKNFMADENITFSEISKRLGTSETQTNRILKGEANFTTKTIFNVAEVIGRKPRIVFE